MIALTSITVILLVDQVDCVFSLLAKSKLYLLITLRSPIDNLERKKSLFLNRLLLEQLSLTVSAANHVDLSLVFRDHGISGLVVSCYFTSLSSFPFALDLDKTSHEFDVDTMISLLIAENLMIACLQFRYP